MNDLICAAADLQGVCDAHRWRYCFIGGLLKDAPDPLDRLERTRERLDD